MIHRMRTFLRTLGFPALSALILTLLLSACASYDGRLNSSTTRYLGTDGTIIIRTSNASLAERVSYWAGDNCPGAPSIVINIPQQKVYYYKAGKLVGLSACSTGREGHDSPVGHFRIQLKEKQHASNLYGDFVDGAGNVVMANIDVTKDKPPPGTRFEGSKMHHFMRFSGGIGMHEGFLPGYPASHGCVRMPAHMAATFYNNVSKGTPVTVRP
jgi:hypothetical protein